MISVSIKDIEDIHTKLNTKIENQRKQALKKLKLINQHQFDTHEVKFLDDTIQLFSQVGFLTQAPGKIETLATTMGLVPPNSRWYKNGKPKKQLKTFILSALNYTYIRNTFYPEYFNEIGIKACVYCNSQLTVTVKKQGNKYGARFDVDHFFPKNKYPYLSISLFNLYPSCTSCNRIKKENMVDFSLYSDNQAQLEKSAYSFELTKASKARYRTSKNKNDLEVLFHPPSPRTGFVSTGNLFHIEQLYRTQLDVVEDLIFKSQIYTSSLKKTLRQNFSKLNLNDKVFERLIVGNYVKDSEIHKRPLAKFSQDIARDLKLIPKLP